MDIEEADEAVTVVLGEVVEVVGLSSKTGSCLLDVVRSRVGTMRCKSFLLSATVCSSSSGVA